MIYMSLESAKKFVEKMQEDDNFAKSFLTVTELNKVLRKSWFPEYTDTYLKPVMKENYWLQIYKLLYDKRG